ncbi:hypothetical protein [Novosphingobium huizhouense]|uniref:hypothetical protein n=1 Tax=Novosphingobium huizhouense TaxID=2866625 RepID=UPI001CD8A1AF|nr:hypothetical protein [Novosphingobium huizhouense]
MAQGTAPGTAPNPAGVWQLPTGGDSSGSPRSPQQVAQALLTPTRRESCAAGAGDAIVVCGANPENARQKLDSVAPLGAGRTADGAPRAPDVSGLADCSKGCIGFGRVPPPMYYFDIAALPAPPAGSDADRIARGEIRAP